MDERERCAREVTMRNVSGVNLSVIWNRFMIFQLMMVLKLS